MRSDYLAQPITQATPIDNNLRPELLQSLAAAARTSVTVTGLRDSPYGKPGPAITIRDVKANANVEDIFEKIRDMGKSIY
jgi:hypothetical protein